MASMVSKYAWRYFLRNAPPRSPRAVSLVGMNTIQSRNRSTQPNYEGHIPVNWLEHGVLFLGASYQALFNPQRADMVAAVADLTSGPVLPHLRECMLASPEGRRILKQRPRINSNTVDLHQLALLPEGTFGKAYVTWLERCNVTPDSREPADTRSIPIPACKVHYVDDPELAYVLQRYRECHDFYHCIVDLPVDGLSELAVKFFEFANLGLPMAGFAAAFGHLRLMPKKRERLIKEYAPWAIKCGSSARNLITVYWEERWEQNVEEMKKEFGLWDAPEAVWRRPLHEAKAAAAQRQKEAEANLATSAQ